MPIKKIKFTNFKSFSSCSETFSDLNVFIGGNASGKSNFVSLLKFISSLFSLPISDCIVLQGGVELFRNHMLSSDYPSEILVKFAHPFIGLLPRRHFVSLLYSNEFDYKLTIDYGNGIDFRVRDLIRYIHYYKKHSEDEPLRLKPPAKTKYEDFLTISLYESGKYRLLSSRGNIKRSTLFPTLSLNRDFSLLGNRIFPVTVSGRIATPVISCFNIDPRLSRQPAPPKETLNLEEDGSNLALVISRVIRNDENREKLESYLKFLLPFVDNLAIRKYMDRLIQYEISENYYGGFKLPSMYISDGTANILCILFALFFDKSDIVVIEEPERSLHPALIKRIIELIQEASSKKQIFITTHNPEVIKYINIDNLYLVHRDDEGYSQITRPKDSHRVRTFLRHEIGIDQLFVDNILE